MPEGYNIVNDHHNTGATPGPGYNAVLEVRNESGVLVTRYFLYDSPIPWSIDMDVLWENETDTDGDAVSVWQYPTEKALLIFRTLKIASPISLELESD